VNFEEPEGLEEKNDIFSKKYRYLIELINNPVVELNLDGIITYISPQCYDLLGFLPEELIGKSVFKFIHPEDLITVKNAIRKAFDSKEILSERFRILRKNGSYIYIISKGKSVNFDRTSKLLVILTGFGKEVEIFNQIITTSNLAKDLTTLLKDIQETILEIMNFDGGGIYLVDRSNQTANVVCSKGLDSDILNEVNHVKINDPRYKKIFIDGEPLFVENYHIHSPERSKKSGFLSIASVPLMAKNEIIGALNIASKNRYTFSDEEKIIFNSLSREIGNVIVRFLSNSRDITERKLIEQKLKESENKYRTLFDSSPIGIGLADLDGNILTANRKMEEITGYSFDELKHVKLASTYVDSTDRIKLLNKMQEFGRVQNFEVRLKKKNATDYDALLNIDLIEINGKQFLYTNCQDISNIKEAEKELRESEENFRNIAEQSLMGICILQDGLIKYVNKKLADLYGYTVEEMLNWKPEEFTKVVAPDSLEIVVEQAKKKQLGIANVINQYVFRCIKKNGEKFWVDNLSKTIIYKGRTADLIAQIDVSEKKEAEKELENLNKLKFDLITRTSHELKTPLMAIKGYSDLLTYKYGTSFSKDALHITEEIKKGSVKLETLIRDVITTAELDAGSVHLEKSEENLSLLIKSCVSDVDSFAKSRNIIIDLKINEDLILYLEKKQIYNVINNLLTNALKYTPPGGKIEIRSRKKIDYVIISIKDTGVGFTDEEKKQIFKQFGKIERYGQGLDVISDGTGLGLYISKRIIELHRGEIWMESEGSNKGSTFYISLPLIYH